MLCSQGQSEKLLAALAHHLGSDGFDSCSVARDEAVSGVAGAAVAFPQGAAASPWGCAWDS